MPCTEPWKDHAGKYFLTPLLLSHTILLRSLALVLRSLAILAKVMRENAKVGSNMTLPGLRSLHVPAAQVLSHATAFDLMHEILLLTA